MRPIRFAIDNSYPLIRNRLFRLNGNDAHRAFTKIAQRTTDLHLEKILLDHPVFHRKSTVQISNAAGFNKNAEISLPFLYYLGLDRVVIGTVTAKQWAGNPEPNIERFAENQSMVNWMGLPGDGAAVVSDRLNQQVEKYYGTRIPAEGFPITINLMATPGSATPLEDIQETITQTRDIHHVDRYELNISCPNTEALTDFDRTLDEMIQTVNSNKLPHQDLYLKISPDTLDMDSKDGLSETDVELILRVSEPLGVSGYTTTNTTRYHDPEFIAKSPGKGGASGEALYMRSLAAQMLFQTQLRQLDSDSKLIACGGINSRDRLLERTDQRYTGPAEAQIFTPLIYKGSKLLTDLKHADYNYQ